MRILLLGEYSNVHWTLAEGLRELGHDVTVVSDGDNWKNYRRDINLKRHSLGFAGTARYMFDVVRTLPKLKGYDIVQIINPMFLSLKAEKMYPFYKYVRKNNGKLFMGAFGMDYYWVKAGMDCKTFRYSDFNIGDRQRTGGENALFIRDWLYGAKGELNRRVAEDCDGIISGLYEYDVCYRPYYADKLRFIPFPINMGSIEPIKHDGHKTVRFFIGIQKLRSEYKGTDIMLKALERLKAKYPDECEIVKVESVPFDTYKTLMDSSDAILDQLYSYTPAMNALLAMAKGLILVGGGEEENYSILDETELRPIINVLPNEDDVFRKLEWLVQNKNLIPKLSEESVEYIRRHHDHVKVAKQYVDFWNSCPRKN